MTSPKAVLKSVGPKLVPFFKTVAIYFVLFLPNANPSYFGCLIKCLPVVSLCVFVLLHGMNLRDEYAYSRRILGGLAFSCIGDAFLLYPQYFLQGMACFGVAHILYTSAFGFHPFNPYAGTFCLVIFVGASSVLLPAIESSLLMTCVSIYIALIGVMVWRAIARVQLFEDLWTWTKLCSCAGGIFFCTSDALIGIDHFLFPIPYSQALVMVSYYAAQFGIALSVVDSMAVASPKKKSVEEVDAGWRNEQGGKNVLDEDRHGSCEDISGKFASQDGSGDKIQVRSGRVRARREIESRS